MTTIHPYTEELCAELAMDMRELKGLEIAARSKVTFDGEAWLVPSQSLSHKGCFP